MKKWAAKTAHQLLLILIYIKNAVDTRHFYKIGTSCDFYATILFLHSKCYIH